MCHTAVAASSVLVLRGRCPFCPCLTYKETCAQGGQATNPVLTEMGIERRPEIPGCTLLAPGAGGLEAIGVFASFLART